MKAFALFFLYYLGSFQPFYYYNPGDKVDSFTLKDGISDANVSLQQFSGSKAVVIVFSSMICPYSRLNEQRLIELAENYKKREVSVVFVNPNTDHEDEATLDMKEYAKIHGITFPYLKDPKGTIARKFQATKTPEVFLLQPTSSGFILKYKGAVDNSPQKAGDATEKYLENALLSVLNNSPIVIKETRVIGCIIRY